MQIIRINISCREAARGITSPKNILGVKSNSSCASRYVLCLGSEACFFEKAIPFFVRTLTFTELDVWKAKPVPACLPACLPSYLLLDEQHVGKVALRADSPLSDFVPFPNPSEANVGHYTR